MSSNDIAIIGMAGRFPGAATVADFWTNVRDGVESIRLLSDEELIAAGVPDDDLAHPGYVKACPVLDGVDQFDAGFFGFSPRDASVMDPAHRLFLEVAWEAMENAGHTGTPDEGPVAVFAGSGAPYYLMDHVRRNSILMRSMGEFLARHTNNDMNFLATRVSYEMDLRGPSINVQTACSSALVAVHMACDSLRRGDCRMAIAGGSTVLIPDRHGYVYEEGEIMSPDGHCRPFDEHAAGTVFGSGSGCVILKPLQAALDDGDTIHAVIKGSAVNNDGALRVGFLAPGVEGQRAVVGLALDAAGVSAESITYLEAHGTGTRVGDPIEVAALNQVFRQRTAQRGFCALGSVKANIGHLGEAAGIASLIKAVMALKHRELPPTLGYRRPNPHIDFDDSPFFVNDRLRPWNSPGPLRCGVTALGAGGTNCHVVLEEAPPTLDSEGAREAQLLVLSAHTPAALSRAREHLAQMLESENRVALPDVAWTLATGRRPMAHRYALVVRDSTSAVRLLRDQARPLVTSERANDTLPSVVFMFPGGGAQYPRMGVELFEREAVYRQAANACFAIIDPALGRRLESLLFCAESDVTAAALELERPSLTLPALFTTEFASACLFRSWGIEPASLVGHSMGEYVAACLSGVMTLDEALRLVMLRGRLFEATERGAMLSVPLPEAALRAVMPEGVSVAAVNAPELSVASGPVAAIDALERALRARDIDCTRVRIDVAAHSSLLDPVLEEFRAFCRVIDLKPPQIPFLSNVSGQWITPEQATDPNYWVTHLRSTVRFADCLATLNGSTGRVFLEVGPGRTLSTLARAQARPATLVYNSMRHGDEATSDLDVALGVVGKLWLAGVAVDWTALYDGQVLNRIPLPTYSWDHARHWIDAPVRAQSGAEDATLDDARHTRVEQWFERPVWRQTLPPQADVPGHGQVLLFIDDRGFGARLSSRLSDLGLTVISVRAGTEFTTDRHGYTVRAAAPEDYAALVKALATAGGLPSRLVHAWGVTGGGPASLAWTLDHGFHSLLCLARALADEDPDASFVLDVVTSDLQRIGGEITLDPTKALVLGPARVMPQEFPNVRMRAIDVTLPAAPKQEALAALVANEIATEPAAQTVAFRGSDRFELELEPVRLDRRTSRVREGGVYLITGAFGGLGYTLAAHLARAYHAKLVLLGRGAMSDSARARVAALVALGAEVEVVQADVTDAVQVRSAVSRAHERFGALHGVFHAAGLLGDSLMAFKTRDDADRVLAPKVQGTLALDAAVRDSALDLFVLFSSISSWAGLAGQADYTAANAFLDAFAQERNTRDRAFTVAVNWSAWRDVGMAANLAAGAGAAGVGRIDEELHPLLGRRIWASPDADLFASKIAVDAHWVVGEHRLRGGRSLMPGTGHLEIVRAALAARPQPRPIEIRDVTFISAFVVPDDAVREMRVHVTRHRDAGQLVVIASRAAAPDGSDVWHEHVTATAAYVDEAAPSPLDIRAIVERCTVREAVFAPSQDSVHMDFGGRWKNLQSIRYGHGEAIVTLQLPDVYADDLEAYPLHPALLDMATGRCEGLVAHVDASRDFFVPLSYARVRVFAPLTNRLYSHVRLAPSEFDAEELLVFDVTIADASGRVLVEIAEFMMVKVPDTTQLQSLTPRVDTRRVHASFDVPAAPAGPQGMAQILEGAIGPAEGIEALEHVLAGPAVSQVFATPMRAGAMMRRLRRAATRPAARPVGANGAVDLAALPDPVGTVDDSGAPRTEVELLIASIWKEVLGVERVSVHDNFFDVGGHSLLAVRMVVRIEKRVGIRLSLPLSVLFDSPTILELAVLIRDRLAPPDGVRPGTAAVFKSLVTVQRGQGCTPLFFVHGGGGNVLNVRDLAAAMSPSQPVYGLQAAGVDGVSRTHETIEAMADAYLAEVQTVQAHGPYLLAGYSGGGIVAFEMARRLSAVGEPVGLLAFIDSFHPQVRLQPASTIYRLGRLRREGVSYLRGVLERMQLRLRRKRDERLTAGHLAAGEPIPFELRELHLMRNFERAARHYQPMPWSGHATLYRAEQADHLLYDGGPTHGWDRVVLGGVTVVAVPGDHDTLLLGANVQRIASSMGVLIDAAVSIDDMGT